MSENVKKAHKLVKPSSSKSCALRKQDIWASTPWLEFEEIAKSFVRHDGENDGLLPAFDAVLQQIEEIVSTHIDAKTKKSGQTFLQLFTQFPSDGFIPLQSYARFRQRLEREEADAKNATITTSFVYNLLLHIRWQIRLRLALWQHMGTTAFVTSWMPLLLNELPSRRRRRVKRDGQGVENAWTIVCEDFTSLVSLGLLKTIQGQQQHQQQNLREEFQVDQFLESCQLGQSIQMPAWKSRLVLHLGKFFDLVDEDEPVGVTNRPANNKCPPPSAVLPPLPVANKDDDSISIKSKTSQATASTNKENKGCAFLDQRVSLTTRHNKKNALLGTSGRTRFTGSHFNTNLTNMSALFRTVPDKAPAVTSKPIVQSKRQMIQTTHDALAQKRSAFSSASHETCSPRANRSRPIQVDETPAPKRLRSRVVWETPDCLHQRPRSLQL